MTVTATKVGYNRLATDLADTGTPSSSALKPPVTVTANWHTDCFVRAAGTVPDAWWRDRNRQARLHQPSWALITIFSRPSVSMALPVDEEFHRDQRVSHGYRQACNLILQRGEIEQAAHTELATTTIANCCA